MRTIKILGTGCTNCKTAEKIIEEVITALKLNVKVEKVENLQEIMNYDVMSTPAIVIDEKVVIKGRVPSKSEIIDLLTSNVCCNSTDDNCCGDKSHSNTCCETEDDIEKSSCCQPDSNCC